jgi:predicted homoserine dehydrogenase-like protein
MAEATACLQKKGIVEYVRMQDCKENWLHAVFKYASVDHLKNIEQMYVALTMKPSSQHYSLFQKYPMMWMTELLLF